MSSLVISIIPSNGVSNMSKHQLLDMKEALLRFDNKKCEILIRKPLTPMKTSMQRAYWFGVIVNKVLKEISRQYNTKEDSKLISDDMIESLGFTEITSLFGVDKIVPIGISKMTKEQMSKLIDSAIIAICSEHISIDGINGHSYGLNFLYIETEEEYNSRVTGGICSDIDGVIRPYIVSPELYYNNYK